MKLEYRFVLSGMAIGAIISLMMMAHQAIKIDDESHDFERIPITGLLARQAGDNSDIQMLFEDSLRSLMLVHLKNGSSEDALKTLSTLTDEKSRLYLLSRLVTDLEDLIDNNSNSDPSFSQTLASFFRLMLESEPDFLSTSYLSALNEFYYILEEMQKKDLADKWAKATDSYLKKFPTQFNAKMFENYQTDSTPMSQQRVEKADARLFGIVLTACFGAIGFVLSALFKPFLEKKGQQLASIKKHQPFKNRKLKVSN